MLTLEVRNHPQVTVLQFSGRIVRGDEAETLLRTVMSQDSRRLQIDLGSVETIDASGLGALVALQKWAKDGDRTIEIVNPSKHVLQAIETTELDRVLRISRSAHCSNAA